ncbi:P-loop containing nucleoside triphosphate hydrolase protein [Chlamydoabsidia padenii]|nr:P-loop containing nucleoside triphosphate hydrolase protein [Chlamydoabsidia padenii]
MLTNGILNGLRPLVPSLMDELFWEQLVGAKTLSILKLLMKNETLLVSGSVFLGPAFATYIKSVYYSIKNYIEYRLYVSIEVDDQEIIYRPIAAFIAEQMENVDLRKAQGEHDVRQYDDDRDYYYRRYTTKLSSNPSISLQPVLDLEHKFIYNRRTFWVMRLSDEKSSKNVSSSGDAFSRLLHGGQKSSTRITMRGRNIMELRAYMQEWIDLYYAKKDNKLVVYKCSHGRPGECTWEEKATKDIRNFDTVILKKGQKEDLLRDAEEFLKRKNWYAERGIPYRRGCLLSGPPGSGKTTVVRSLVSRLGMKLASISLTGLTSDEEFANMVATAPADCILLLEDVDHCLKVIEDSKGTSNSLTPQSGHITLPGLLNVMDGLDMRDGTIFFMTCNDNNVLPQVMKRRGRIDKEITLGYADEYQISMMFDRFFQNTSCGDKSTWNQVRNKVTRAITPGEFSTAELQGLFLDYTLYLERTETQPTQDSFKDLISKIDQFKLEIQRTRDDWETYKNDKLDELLQKNGINNDATKKPRIRMTNGKTRSKKAKVNGTSLSHSSSSSSLSASSPSTSVSSSSTGTAATTVSLKNTEKTGQQDDE